MKVSYLLYLCVFCFFIAMSTTQAMDNYLLSQLSKKRKRDDVEVLDAKRTKLNDSVFQEDGKLSEHEKELLDSDKKIYEEEIEWSLDAKEQAQADMLKAFVDQHDMQDKYFSKKNIYLEDILGNEEYSVQFQEVLANSKVRHSEKLVPILYDAVKNEDKETAALLLENGAYLSASVPLYKGFKTTALHAAVKSLNPEMVALMLQYNKAIVFAQDSDGNTPLHILAAQESNKSLDVLCKLIEVDPEILNVENNEGELPLHIAAAESQNEKIIEKLITEKTVKTKDKQRGTPLHAAAAAGNYVAMEVLLGFQSTKPDIEAKDNDGNTPLHLMVQYESGELREEDAFVLLLDKGADVNAVNNAGKTPLHIAIETDRYEIVQKLLEHNDIHVNIQDAEGQTALHRAVNGDYDVSPGIMHLLMTDEGIDLDSLDNNGNTPLHLAAQAGDVAIVDDLLYYGAAIDIKNKEGKTAFDYVLALESDDDESDNESISDLSDKDATDTSESSSSSSSDEVDILSVD